MNPKIVIPLAGVLAILAFAPAASASTPYNVCSPGNAVCFVQSTSPFANSGCSGWNYGDNRNQDAVQVNAAGTTATAAGADGCAHWFYDDEAYSVILVSATHGSTSASVVWESFATQYHWPGAPTNRHGDVLSATATNAGSTTGVQWTHIITDQAPFTNTCNTVVLVQNSPTSLGCPAGAPPAVPSEALGSLLP
ncbi:MAG: hypothetical protein ACYDCK_15465 [Thermoplasmatota archaeon]